jgi:hypothetical protein
MNTDNAAAGAIRAGTAAGMATVAGLEALADSLSDSADALHRRIMAAIRKNSSTAGQAISHTEAQALFEQEIALRQQANALYADATKAGTAGLAFPAGELLELAARARDRIGRIDHAKELAGIAAALLGAAAAIAALRPEGLAPALEDLKQHLEALPDADKPPSRFPGGGHTMGA